MEMAKAMTDFLKTVRGSEGGRVERAVALLTTCEIISPEDLVESKIRVIESAASAAGVNVSPGLHAYIARAIVKADDLEAARVEACKPPVRGGDIDQSIDNIGAKKEEKVHVDLGTQINRISLADLHPSVWPKPSPVDQIATEAARLIKRGVDEPYVYVDLKSFLPGWADWRSADEGDASDDENMQSKGFKALASVLERGMLGTQAKPTKRLDIVRWNAAYDKFAVASACVKSQLSYTAALAHKDVYLQVALRATLKGRRAGLGMIYDEIARKAWADRKAAGEWNFQVNDVAPVLDDALLRMAEAIYGEPAPATPAAVSGKGVAGKASAGAKGGGKGGASGIQCYKCGGWGHIAAHCGKGGNKGNADIVCYSCWKPGHKSSDCLKGKGGTKRFADGSAKW